MPDEEADDLERPPDPHAAVILPGDALRWRRLDVDDSVGDRGIARHQLVFHDVGDLMRLVEAHVRAQPDVEIEKDVIFGSARADVMASEDAGHAHDDLLDVGVGHDDAIAEDARSEEHTSELQSRFGISYAVFCLKK